MPTPFERDLGAVVHSFERPLPYVHDDLGYTPPLRTYERLFLLMGPAGIALGVVDVGWWQQWAAAVPAFAVGAMMTWIVRQRLIGFVRRRPS